MRIDPDHPAAAAVKRAELRYERGDAPGCDDASADAVRRAGGDPLLRATLAEDHVARLIGLRDWPRARRRCEEYLRGGWDVRFRLHVMHAEILSASGHVRDAGEEAEGIRRASLAAGRSLAPGDDARLCRIQGRAVADRGDHELARFLLDRARGRFAEAGDAEAVRQIERETTELGVLTGAENTAPDIVAGGPRETAADEYVVGCALKRLCRYEEALQVMAGCAFRTDLPPEMRWPVLRDLTLLLRATGREESGDLRSLLAETAAQAPDRPRAEAELARLYGREDAAPDGTFCEQIQHARRLLAANRLDRAEPIVRAARDRAATDAEIALWHLAAGELELGRAGSGDRHGHLGDAITHLELSIERTHTITWLLEIRVEALRLLGRAHFRSPGPDGKRCALNCWDEARRTEEQVVALQVTDDVRRGMSLTVADTYDEWIDAAAAEGDELGMKASAAVVAAMEAARGAAILPAIMPGDPRPVRGLPRPGDHDGAWAWLCDFGDRLPRDQAVWIMHAARGHVHHAVVGRRRPGLLGRGHLLRVTVPCDRKDLQRAVDRLAACWSDKDTLLESQADGTFGERLADVAARTGVAEVIRRLPAHVRRIAVVAGDMLSDVPLGGLTTDDGTPLGVRFALSDLPCLSAREPLRTRSRRLRGDSRLLISPLPAGAPHPVPAPGREMILGAAATPEALRDRLELRRDCLVHIYSHGRHDYTSADLSRLRLAPDGERGILLAGDLQRMDLRRCGTIVLGACETGMALRVGRDERTGFVRSALVAGAASAVAARWVAPAEVAVDLLDRFEAYARCLPRDVALQRALRDGHEGAPGTPAEAVPAWRHPANWACWTLYGDAGLQTDAGPVRRKLREIRTWRRHAGRH